MNGNRKAGRSLSQSQFRQRRITQSTYEAIEPRRLLASAGWDGPGQGSAELTYYVGNAPSGISQAEFESTIEDALEVWSGEIDVTFTQTDRANQPDSLDFTSRPIDGSGGVLARAYFPDDVNRGSIAGDVHFDISDQWEIGNEQGFRATDLMYVAVHEIGHSLGLEHLDDHDSVLSDTVSKNQSFDSLSQHDIDAAMALYAPARPAAQTPNIDTPLSTDFQTNTVDSNDVGDMLPGDEPSESPHQHPEHSHDNPVDEDETDNGDSDSDHHDEEESDRQDRRRFWRIINHFARRFRVSFWNQVAFLRW